MKKIVSIEVKRELDPFFSLDLEFIGKYTDTLEPGVIIRAYGEFYEKLPAPMERNYDGRFLRKGSPDLPSKGREYRGFKPYAGGEKWGTKEYYAYGWEDFSRMEAFERGEWWGIGIRAIAVIAVSLKEDDCWIEETIDSPGLWGIESDIGGSYLQGIEQEELECLTLLLKEYGFSQEEIQAITPTREES